MPHNPASTDIWLVIHIPKTAGTSFRWALEKQFGKSSVVWDYGPSSEHTSEIVRKHIYEEVPNSGQEELIKEMSKQGSKILIGHVPLQKYAKYFKPENIIAFVRDPLIRNCSEYLHRVNNASFNGSFSDFLKKPGFQNLQSRFLHGSSASTFIGITEQYRESLRCLNRVFDWSLKARKKNVARFSGGQKFAKNLSKQELDLFFELNKMDIALYQAVEQSFEAHKRASLKHVQRGSHN